MRPCEQSILNGLTNNNIFEWSRKWVCNLQHSLTVIINRARSSQLQTFKFCIWILHHQEFLDPSMLGDVGQCWIQRFTNTNPLFQPVAWKCYTAIVSPSFFFYFSLFSTHAVFVFFTLVNSFLSWSKLLWNELSP